MNDTQDWGDLAPQHRYYLETRGVTPAVAAARGYSTGNTKKQLEELGFGQAQRRVPALVVPVYPPWASEAPVVYQIRPDVPRRNAEGKALKFEYPARATMHLDVHPQMRQDVGDNRVPLVIVEGVVKGDAGVSRLGVCVVAVAGVWCWRGTNDDGGRAALADWEHVALADRDIIVCFDSDVMLKPSVHGALTRLGALLERRGANRLHFAYLPSGEHRKPVGLDDWLASRDNEPDQLVRELAALCVDRPIGAAEQVTAPYVPPARQTLAEVDDTFRKWLSHPDLEAVRAVLAAVVANRAPGDPDWLLVIAPPSSGKTETLTPLAALPDVIVAGRLTVGALLSGTSSGERTADATGGLLRQVGERGILVNKDFGTILAMSHDARAEVLQALRDIFDGRYTRHVGTDGGRALEWSGRAGFIAGATEAIDSHHAVIAALGDRFISIRLKLPAAEAQATRAMADGGDEDAMRSELGEAVAGLLGHLANELPPVTAEERQRLARLATLAVRCRSIVERDTYSSREIVNVPGAEQPARLAKQMAKLFAGLQHIGCTKDESWLIVERITRDSMPAGRCKVLRYLAGLETRQTTGEVGEAVGLPTTTVRRLLEDLEAHGIVQRTRQSKGLPDQWVMGDWCRERWPTVPEDSGSADTDDEGVPENSGSIDNPFTEGDTSIDVSVCMNDFSGTPSTSNGHLDPDAWVAEPW